MWKRENAPYLVTIIVAALGWLITRSVDETMKSPLVAYSLKESMENGNRIITARLRNISSATVFRNLYVVLTNLDGTSSKFVRADLQYEAPVHPNLLRKGASEHAPTWAGALVTELQPRTAVRLKTWVQGTQTPTLRYDSATDTVRLIEESPLTWAVEHEGCILLSLAGILALVLGIYIICLASGRIS